MADVFVAVIITKEIYLIIQIFLYDSGGCFSRQELKREKWSDLF